MATWVLPACFIGTDCAWLGYDPGHLGGYFTMSLKETRTKPSSRGTSKMPPVRKNVGQGRWLIE